MKVVAQNSVRHFSGGLSLAPISIRSERRRLQNGFSFHSSADVIYNTPMTRRFQFSLKWLLAAPALCGIVAAAFMAESWWFRVLAIRLLLITAFGLIATMLFSRTQFMAAFARAAVFPAFVGAVLAVEPLFSGRSYPGDGSLGDLVLSNFDDGNMNDHADFKFRAAFLLTATLLGGLAGVVIGLLDSNGDEK